MRGDQVRSFTVVEVAMKEVSPEDWSWVNATADRFERDWKRGRGHGSKTTSRRCPSARRGPLLDELLRVEMEIRSRGGERPTAEEYRLRFPEHASVIDDVFGEGTRSVSAGSGVASTAAEQSGPQSGRFAGVEHPGPPGPGDRPGPSSPAP